MTLTLVATEFPFHSPPRVQLDITSTNTGPDAVDPSAQFVIKRNDPDGRARNVILAPNPHLTTGTWSGFDNHAWFNRNCTYTVKAGTVTANSGTVNLASDESWLMHRTNPGLSVRLDSLTEIGDRTHGGTSAIHWPFAAKYPVSKSEGVTRAPAGQLIVRCESEENLAAVLAVMEDSAPILVNLANNVGWWDETWAWAQRTDLATTNHGGTPEYPYRHVTIPYQVVDTPAAAIAPLWTYAMVLADLGTYPVVLTTYASYADMAIDHRSV